MPKLVPNVAVTVIRDGKRVTPPSGPGAKAFDFTKEEVEAVSKQMPTAFRKPVNESAGDDETAPEGDAGATANQTPKRPAKETAAKKSATSKKATTGGKASGEPKDTAQNADQESQDEDADDDADENADDDDTAGEDDDI